MKRSGILGRMTKIVEATVPNTIVNVATCKQSQGLVGQKFCVVGKRKDLLSEWESVKKQGKRRKKGNIHG